MNELAANTSPLFSYGVLAIIIVVALIAWFFVNRASMRASEQIRLLEALLEEQKNRMHCCAAWRMLNLPQQNSRRKKTP